MHTLVFLLAAAVVVSPPSAVDEVRRAETAFAKAFADRDQERFFKFVLDDATFLPPLNTLAGKEQVVSRWSRFFQAKEAPFSWLPERVVTNAAGTVGLSSGPVFDAKGEHTGNFSSVWLKQPDGSWKVLFDGPGFAPVPVKAASFEEGDIAADDGAKLHYRKFGDGPVKVIVPLDFVVHDFFKWLGDVATVITYDPRNRGRSSRVENVNSLTIDQDVRDLEAVRRHFKIERFVPVGYSYLGLMVVMYAVDYPEHVDRIVQLGPVPGKFGTEYAKELTHGNQDVAASDADVKAWRDMQASGAEAKTPREFCEAQGRVFQYVLVGNPANASRVQSHCDLENEWPVNFSRHMEHHFASVQKVSLTSEQLQRVTVPVLTIHGTFDRNAPYGSGREWAMSLPNARLVTVEGAAHQSWADDPAAVLGAIRSFLRGGWPLTAERVTTLAR
jgi:proline iminopeptidase